MDNKRVTIADIAEELGLSTATVSNVIHGKTKRVSEETIRRVEDLLEKRQYIPNMAGILLARNNSGIIGIIINDHPKYEGKVLEDGFMAASLNALSKVMNQSGYFMMVKTTSDWDEIVTIASMWNMEGLILIGFCEQDYQRLRNKMHIPFVVYDGYFSETEKIVNLTVDHYGGGYQVGRYLKSMGHKKVLCLSDNFICMDKERMDGVNEGLSSDQISYLQIPMQKEVRECFYQEHFYEIRQHTAVFAVSDFYAVDFIHFMQKQGVSIPDDISVVGFDDNFYSRNNVPPVTTVRQDANLRARTALKALEDLKAGKTPQYKIVLPVELILRESVKRL